MSTKHRCLEWCFVSLVIRKTPKKITRYHFTSTIMATIRRMDNEFSLFFLLFCSTTFPSQSCLPALYNYKLLRFCGWVQRFAGLVGGFPCLLNLPPTNLSGLPLSSVCLCPPCTHVWGPVYEPMVAQRVKILKTIELCITKYIFMICEWYLTNK